ncbi:MAG TPA: hypothetical protein VF533_04595 [Solirubrobacteraceae bacterium]|jgi:hypothetical protein
MGPDDDEVAPGWLPPQPPPDAPPAAPPAPALPPARLPIAPPAGPTDPLAPFALGLGVVGLLLIVLSAGAGFLFTLPLSVAAWRVGAASRRRIAEGRAAGGDGLAQAAIFLGLAGIGIAVVGMIGWAILAGNGYSPEDLRDELERRSR